MNSKKSARRGLYLAHGFFLLVILITFRHLLIPGDHLWTGEGARFSWSMRLRGKVCAFEIKAGPGNKEEAMQWRQPNLKMLRPFQFGNLDDPFLFYLYVKNVQCPSQGTVYGRVSCRAISHQTSPLIDPGTDLCHADYSFIHHNDWITSEPGPWDPDYLRWFSYHQQQNRTRQRGF